MEIEKIETTALESLTRGETDVAINTAKKFPRSVSRFRQDAMSMATADEEVASSCFYKMVRGGKSIEGPSVRLAEIVASAWGNLNFGARIVEEGDKFVTAQGVAHDLEKNVRTTIEVRRRITDKNGMRFGDDMIGVTCNAACAIALRNAIFKTVPFVYVKLIYEQARKTAIGNAKTLESRRTTMVEQFKKMGVPPDSVINFVGKANLEDIGLHEIEILIGTFTAIKDGDTTIEEQFPDVNVVLTPEEKDLQTKCKKMRAALNRDLLKCKTDPERLEVVTKFQVENGGAAIWGEPTYLRTGETFGFIADEHKARIAESKTAIMARINHAKTKADFETALEEFKLHDDLQTVQNEETIKSVGKGLGIEEYFG